ncbi:MAG: type 1 periplasmic binding fold superfamily protein [Flavobacteriales bacterium]
MKLVQLNSINPFKLKTMKTMKTSAFYALLTLAMLGCSDDDTTPEIINEDELITTVILTLTPDSGDQVVLTTVDLDGDGPDEPVTTVVGSFLENTQYQGAVQFLNETEDPAEDITQEVIEEADEHQVFYTISEGLNIQTTYEDQDSQGNPLGVQITLSTGAASEGSLTVTLRHEPVKPNDGLESAGGETDISTSFDVSIQ